MRITKGFNRTVAFSWAGGKKWMADIIGLYLPSDIKRLLIPFFGRGDYLRLIRNMGVEAPARVLRQGLAVHLQRLEARDLIR